MTRAVRIDRCVWICAGVLAGGLAQAAPEVSEAAASQPSLELPGERSSTLRLGLPRTVSHFSAESSPPTSQPKPFADLGVSVVELPSEGLPGARSRPHHALSIATDAPRSMLRSIGIDATECATRFRLPTKVQRDAYGNARVDVRAHLGLACGF